MNGRAFLSMENAEIILTIPVLFFSLSLHEYAHARAALWAGDDTALRAGRLTLNPIAHVDPIGTVFLPLLFLVRALSGGGGFFFGWAKPVPVNPARFRKAIWDVYVSFAGPASNFILAIISAIIFKIIFMANIPQKIELNPELWQVLMLLIFNFIALNVLLGLFNLIPIPPLDGSHIFFHFFVRPLTRDHILFQLFMFLERFGFIVLLLFFYGIPSGLNPFSYLFKLTLQGLVWFIHL